VVIVDARSLSPEEHLEADVCIVGAGPAGITLALELLETGARICLLESGGVERRAPAGGESVGYPYHRLETAGIRAFGGSSLHWGSGNGDYWNAVPFDRLDFESRPGIPHSGWPFPRSELVPFFERAAAAAGIGPFVYSADPADDDDLAGRLPVEPGRLVSSYFQFATSTFVRYFDRLSTAPDVRLLLNATAAEIRMGDDGGVEAVRALSAPGRAFEIRARLTVLAAGGLENPRLLLSPSASRPAGVGNEHDLVGRYFMEHVTVRSGAVTPSSPAILDQRRLYSEYERAGAHVRPTLRLHESVTRAEELLNVTFLLDPKRRSSVANGVRSLSTLRKSRELEPRPERLAAHARNVLADLPDVVREVVRKQVSVARADVLAVRVQAEQAPYPASRVTLSPRRDPLGLLLPRLDWRMSELDVRSVRRTQELLDAELRRAGLGKVDDLLGSEDPPALILGIHHHMGTTRMHADPRQGVVDADCRVHGVPDLYVAGTSVFPTAGWANPTFTMLAVTIRLADHLKQRLGAA
jgi:choline dehydrogenase-like flavoprotein